MSKSRLYWYFQIGGWGAYFLNETFAYAVQFGYEPYLWINALANVLIGVLLTHFFRYIIKKYNWIQLPFRQLVPRIMGVILGLTFVFVLINIPLDYRYTQSILEQNPALVSQYFVNLSKPIFIWSLIYIFYHYFDERKKKEIELIQLSSSIKEAEAKVLRAQLNPHFMFNALNSIRALVIENPSKAQESITQLSNLLRSSLIADRRKTISLREELKTIEDYLALEKTRYEERLQIKWDIAPETLPIEIPPMMLQTLVENAIKHGVQKTISWGFIEINSRLIAKTLAIKIRNTGTLNKIDDKAETSGFGLINTIQRLKIIYGDAAKFDIYQENSRMVCAEIKISLKNSNTTHDKINIK